MRRVNVALTAAAAVALSAAPLSAQWGIFGNSSSRVPAGHMPSAGMCRVWIDGVPPGQQPRQTDCRTAERQRPYYEQRYGRNARVIYGSRSNGRYDTRNRDVVYGRRDGNCRYVERVVMGRVVRQRVCDDNGVYGNDRVYGRNDRVYDRNGRVYDRNDRVYDRNGNVVYRRNGVYSRNDRWDNRRNDRDSDDKGKWKNKNKNKGRKSW